VVKGKGKAIPVQAYYRPSEYQEVEAPRFLDNRHMKLVRLLSLGLGHLYPQEIFLIHIYVRGWQDYVQ
jgi:hypothetical protein